MDKFSPYTPHLINANLGIFSIVPATNDDSIYCVPIKYNVLYIEISKTDTNITHQVPPAKS